LFFLHNLLELRPGHYGQARSRSVVGTMNGNSTSNQTQRVEGTNVVRVPFGVRQARRRRPQRPDHWATLVLPFQAGGGNPTPPQAA
jgi:hypothetical protein